MDFYITVFIFIIILFLYVHVMSQYKKGEDLEIYEMDYTTNAQFQEICNTKQPILVDFKKVNPDIFTDLDSTAFLKHASCDIKLRDIHDENSVDSIPLKYDSFRKLTSADSRSHFITEGNMDFIEESGLYSEYAELNAFLKPAWTIHQKYDLLQGSEGAYTPLRYHTDERQFYIISSGKITVKMTPWKSRKYLYPIMDFSIYEFRSPVDAWNNQKNEQHGYMNDVDKLKFLEFDVIEGFVLYIPPYWWYSIKYSTPDTLVLGATYNTTPRILANSWDIMQYYLQQSNTTTKVAKTVHGIVEVAESDKPENTAIEERRDSDELIDPLKYVE
jgi:hypothetical protein